VDLVRVQEEDLAEVPARAPDVAQEEDHVRVQDVAQDVAQEEVPEEVQEDQDVNCPTRQLKLSWLMVNSLANLVSGLEKPSSQLERLLLVLPRMVPFQL